MNNDSQPKHPSENKHLQIIKLIRRLSISIVLICLLIIGGAAAIGYYYQNEVKGLVISEINKQLNTQIIIDGKDIHFTILKSFPYAAVRFDNVKALEVSNRKNKDTLFKAGSISLQFNVLDIYYKKYRIKKIEIENVTLNIRINKMGKDNYHFWKSTTNSNNDFFSFALEDIILKSIQLNYKNYKLKQLVDLFIDKGAFSGNFSNEQYALNAKSGLYINTIRIDQTNYLKNKNIRLNTSIEINNSKQSYKINKGEIEIEKLLFELAGNIINQSSNTDELIMDLDIEGKNIDIKSILSLIPQKHKKVINDYESDGDFYFKASLKGAWSDKKSPILNADFGINDATITRSLDNISLQNVNLKGNYYLNPEGNNSIDKLVLAPFSVNLNQGSVSGELALTNLSNPIIDAKIKAQLQLAEIQKLIRIDTLESISGELKMDAIFKGKWENLNAQNYKELITQGDLTVSNMNAKMKDSPLMLTALNGDCNFNNNDLKINRMEGKIKSSDFSIKGFFRNCIASLIDRNEEISIDAALSSKLINLEELLANSDEGTKNGTNYQLQFSDRLNIRLLSTIDQLVFRKFEATNIKGLISIENKKLMAEQINLSTMDGNVTLSGLVDGTDTSQLKLTCSSRINNINTTKLFLECENFGQENITDKNIKGTIAANIEMTSSFSPSLIMDLDNLNAIIDMTIKDGELNNVASMKNLSRFVNLSELSNIKFSTLKNSFEIKNKNIILPKMEIHSSAINMTLAGSHSFDNMVDYKIKLSLNELLAKKAGKAKKQNNEFGQIEEDGLGRTNIYLSMKGPVEKPIIKYDSKEALVDLKKDIKEEKTSIKSILKEEFGLFKKDTTLTKPKKKAVPTFDIEWEEKVEQPEVEEKKELRMPKRPTDEEDF